MFLKAFTVVILIVGLNAQFHGWDPFPKDNMKIDLFDHCNTSYCGSPCESTLPPPFCPAVAQPCPLGCSCMAICGTSYIICYESKHCLEKKRVFTRRRTTTTQRLTTRSTRRIVRHY